MDILPDKDIHTVSELYGKYKNIKETSVRIYKDTFLRYYLLKGRCRSGRSDVYSILCVKCKGGETVGCEFAFDISSRPDDAAHIYGVLCRNAVTPDCLFEALDNILYDTLMMR